MSERVNPKCEDCRFFNAWKTSGKSGECRRRAPVGVYDNEMDFVRGGFPEMSFSDWCGEYEWKGDGVHIWKPKEGGEG